MSFKDAPFSQRFNKLGDEAEGIFEAVWPKAWDRWGINRPRASLKNTPSFHRNAPDYWDSDGYIEVMGLGEDQKFKLKDVKQAALYEWHEKWTVRIFVWDSCKKRWAIAELCDIVAALINEGGRAAFSDGPEYSWLKTEHWPGEWTAHDA